MNTHIRRFATLLALGVATAPALAAGPTTDGEVRKIDTAQQKITLKHGEIRNLDMPAMTMVFRVRDAKLLDGVAAGDRVRFHAEKIDGNFTVTALVKAS